MPLTNTHKKQWEMRSPNRYSVRTPKGISAEIVKKISALKKEPQWMLKFRLNAFAQFNQKRNPQ